AGVSTSAPIPIHRRRKSGFACVSPMDDLSPDSALPPAGSAQDNDAPRQLVVCIDGTSNGVG
ncbi:hypothetical protein ACLBQC_32610, partial [Klebsiella pneumoniae]|uniref:hypothetical protein n=1 Tax=Klebsiella pneumoniae TaxID=573 RepID=UPI00396855E7